MECLKLFKNSNGERMLFDASIDIIIQSCNRYTANVTLPTMSNVTPTFLIGEKTFAIPENAFVHLRKGHIVFTMPKTQTLLRKALIEGTAILKNNCTT